MSREIRITIPTGRLPLLLTGVVVLVIVAAVVVAVTGGDGRSSDDSRTATMTGPRTDRQLASCVGRWNESLPATPGRAAEFSVFLFEDGKCGVSLIPAGAQGVWAWRGGRFEPYLFVRANGAGQGLSAQTLQTATAIHREASRNVNARLGADGRLELLDGSPLVRVAASSRAMVDDAARGTVVDGVPYAIDAAEWNALDLDGRLEAVSAFVVDRNCLHAADAIGRALRDGDFVVVGDSTESTLDHWCSHGEGPARAGATDDGGTDDRAGTPTGAEGFHVGDASPPARDR